MEICLIRHGETDWNKISRLQGREDVPLNTNGIFQAEQCGLMLSKRKWSAVFTSPLSRAKQTAEIIAGINKIKRVYIEEDLTERDFGKASGLTIDECRIKYPDGNYGGMEEYNTLQNRAHDAILRCTVKSGGGDIIIVSHGGVINSIIADLTNHSAGSGKTKLKNASISMLTYNNNELKILFYNKTADEM